MHGKFREWHHALHTSGKFYNLQCTVYLPSNKNILALKFCDND